MASTAPTGFPTLFSLAPQNLAQAINPLSLWTKFSGQLGFINVNEMASPDPATEADIVAHVASYGRQLGRISELLEALCAHQDTQLWTADQKAALKAFSDLASDIALAKRGRLVPTHDNVAQMIAGIKGLEKSDRARYEDFVEEIRRGLFSEDRASRPPSIKANAAAARLGPAAPKRIAATSKRNTAPATTTRRRRRP